jgi:hypothetical protein
MLHVQMLNTQKKSLYLLLAVVKFSLKPLPLQIA